LSPAPDFNLETEVQVQELVATLIHHRLIRSAHDVSNGGLFTTLCESAFVNQLGFSIGTDDEIRQDAFLFGESQSRVVVSISPDKQDELVELLSLADVEFSLLGEVTSGAVQINSESWGSISDFKTPFDQSLGEWMEKG
jgi:phosphoribosylformylglycinamidine synthase